VRQVKRLLGLLPEQEEGLPLFVFDDGYDPVQLQQGLEGDVASTPTRPRQPGQVALPGTGQSWTPKIRRRGLCPPWSIAAKIQAMGRCA
jgi:hypothetical protein